MKIIDLHCDTIGEIRAGGDLLSGIPNGHVDIPRMRSGNVGMMVFASFVSTMHTGEEAFAEAQKLLQLTKQIANDFENEVLLIDDFVSATSCINSDKIGILPAVENGHAINNQLKNLEKLYFEGTRYLTLTHSKNLDWAASSGEKKCAFSGLTNFGKQVIHAMNEMGMIIDVSHVHESTFWDVIKTSKKPIIASHSNTSAICPIARNLTDDQIRAIADSGGMVGINFFPGFLDKKYANALVDHCSDLFDALDKIELKYINNASEKNKGLHQFYSELQERMGDTVQVGIEKIVEHIEYVINLAGDDFVGFGSDFDGIPSTPNGVSGCDAYVEIINQLRNRIHNQNSIEKIAYKNFLRVFKDNQ